MKIRQPKRLDHLGLIAATIKHLKLIPFIDQILDCDPQQKVTHGEAIAAMIINGLGFTNSALYLTPRFFSTKATEVLFDRDIQPQDLNRDRLGRTLDAIHKYGPELLFTQVASFVCQQIKVEQTFTSLDTTTFSLTGEYNQDSDEHTIQITHGYSKDHRPDLKQACLELVTTQDGGIPLTMKCFSGNASDNRVFQDRCKKLIKSFQKSEGPKYLVGDSKLYHQNNQEHLAAIKFITRIPKNYQLEQEVVESSIETGNWIQLDEKNQYSEHKLHHLGMEQRWIVIRSKAARNRTIKTVDRQIEREYQDIEQKLKKLHKQVFDCQADAKKAFQAVKGKYKYHELNLAKVEAKKGYQGVGRPRVGEAIETKGYQLQIGVICSLTSREKAILTKSCYVIGTNTSREELSVEQVIEAYKNQHKSVERGFRFLKDPMFFASSLYLKKPSRIMSLLMVMTMSLLVYAVMERHVRKTLKELESTLPNQLNQPTKKPTMRWLFQLMEGIDVVYVNTKGKIEGHIMGLNAVKLKIINLFYPSALEIYGLV